MLAPMTRTQGANADCNPADPTSIVGRVSTALTAGAALALLTPSGRVRIPVGAPCPVRLLARSGPSQGLGSGSKPLRGAMSLPTESAPTLRTLVAVVRLHPGTPFELILSMERSRASEACALGSIPSRIAAGIDQRKITGLITRRASEPGSIPGPASVITQGATRFS